MPEPTDPRHNRPHGPPAEPDTLTFADVGTSVLPGIHAQAVVDAGLAEFVAGAPDLDKWQAIRWTYLDEVEPKPCVRPECPPEETIEISTTWTVPGEPIPTVPAPLYSLSEAGRVEFLRAVEEQAPAEITGALLDACRDVHTELLWWHALAADREAQRITRVLLERLADTLLQVMLDGDIAAAEGGPVDRIHEWIDGLSVFERAAVNRVLGPDSPFAPPPGPESMPIEMPRPWTFKVTPDGGHTPTDYGTGSEDWAEWHWSIDELSAGVHGPEVLAGTSDRDPSTLLDLICRDYNRAGHPLTIDEARIRGVSLDPLPGPAGGHVVRVTQDPGGEAIAVPAIDLGFPIQPGSALANWPVPPPPGDFILGDFRETRSADIEGQPGWLAHRTDLGIPLADGRMMTLAEFTERGAHVCAAGGAAPGSSQDCEACRTAVEATIADYQAQALADEFVEAAPTIPDLMAALDESMEAAKASRDRLRSEDATDRNLTEVEFRIMFLLAVPDQGVLGVDELAALIAAQNSTDEANRIPTPERVAEVAHAMGPLSKRALVRRQAKPGSMVRGWVITPKGRDVMEDRNGVHGRTFDTAGNPT